MLEASDCKRTMTKILCPTLWKMEAPHARFAVCEETSGSWPIAHYAIVYDWDKGSR